MKRIWLVPLLILALTACGAGTVSEEAPGYDQETYQEITITAGGAGRNFRRRGGGRNESKYGNTMCRHIQLEWRHIFCLSHILQ